MNSRRIALLGLCLSALFASRPSIAQMSGGTLSAGAVTGQPGATIMVPILLGSVSNLAAASFTVDFSASNPSGAPPLVLAAGAAGSLAPGSFQASNPVGTQIKVALAAGVSGNSQTLITGPGTLFVIPVTIPMSAATGTVYTVALQSVDLEDGTPSMIPVMTATGSVTVMGPMVASVQVGPASATVAVGNTLQFTATALDAMMNPLSGIPITWSIAAGATAGVAIDAKSGLLTAQSPGVATVQATSGSIVGTDVVTVTPGPVATVTVSPGTFSLSAGATQQFTATAKDAMGNLIANPSLTWTADMSIGTISATGLFTATTVGSGNVTATVGMVSGTAAVTVTPGTVASALVSPPTATVMAGGTQQFTVAAKDTGGNLIPNPTVIWSADGSIGTIDAASGLFHATKAGMGKVTATLGQISASATVTVNPGGVASLTVSPAMPTLSVGATQQFTVTAMDAQGDVIPNTTVVWSADASIGTIDAAGGLFTATKLGSGKVTATAGAISGAANVSVTGMPTLTLVGLSSGQWVHGMVAIAPTITGLIPTGVQVFADAGTTPIASSTVAPFATSVDTTALADGPHILIVKATDAQGHTAQTSVTLNVLNTPPTATITAPTAGQNVRRVVTITGTATAALAGGFSNYLLAVAPGNTTTNATPIGAASATAVTNGTLGTWDTSSLPPGPYTLVLAVTDLAGNQTVAQQTVQVVPFVLGDLNGDGKVNVADATLAVRIAIGLVVPGADQLAAGDLHHTGSISISDATVILRAAIGLGTIPSQ